MNHNEFRPTITWVKIIPFSCCIFQKKHICTVKAGEVQLDLETSKARPSYGMILLGILPITQGDAKHIETWTKWSPFWKWYFENNIIQCKCIICDSNFTKSTLSSTVPLMNRCWPSYIITFGFIGPIVEPLYSQNPGQLHHSTTCYEVSLPWVILWPQFHRLCDLMT